MWLEVGPSNNSPKIVSRYFLETIQQLGGCPNICRCDLGTENKELEEIQIDCLRYCFMDLLQEELHRIVIQWNKHRIQVKKQCCSPKGNPDVLFFTPEPYGARDFKVNCSADDIRNCFENFGFAERPIHGCSTDFLELANLILPNHQRPSNVNEACNLYAQFITMFNQYDG
uniref:Uncharacterized protein n=1 Tax=Magallana gigas TaxID=29159 RepID=A0A8W8LUI7_MAGGI